MSKKNTLVQEVTPWFSPNVKPVREGAYERLYDEGTKAECIVPCRFLGGLWFFEDGLVPSAFQEMPWRGLASKP